MSESLVYHSLHPKDNPKTTYSELVLNYLSLTRDWHTSEEIAEAIHINDSKTNVTIRKAVAELRAIGYPIISSPYGFKFSTDRDEIATCISNLQLRILGIQRAIHNLQRVTK